MNYITMSFMAFIAGIAIATQASINAQLGSILKNSMFATVVAFGSGLLFTLIIVSIITKEPPSLSIIRTVPFYLWFTGGLLSAFAITTIYWLIPQLGVGSVVSYMLAGQLMLAMVVSHFGWFGTPISPITLSKLIGIILLVSSIIFINHQS